MSGASQSITTRVDAELSCYTVGIPVTEGTFAASTSITSEKSDQP